MCCATSHYVTAVIMLGNAGVGKSMLLSRYTRGEFKLGCKATVGVEFGQKTVCIAGDTVGAQIWDTSGQERFASLARMYFRDAVGALLAFDMTSRKNPALRIQSNTPL